MSAHDDVRVSQDAAAAAAAPPPPPPPPSAPPPPLLSSSSSRPVSVLQNPSADEAAVARCVAATPCMPSTQQLRGRHGIQLVVQNLFTLVLREAADALALVDSGRDHDHIVSVREHGRRSSKFPLLLRHCTLNGVESLSRREGQLSEDMCRAVLKHDLFGERMLEAISVSYIEMFPFGSSGGCTKCRWLSKEEASNLPPLRSLWHLHFPSSPP